MPPTDTTSALTAADVPALLSRMSLEEKLAQIVGFWDKGDGDAVAPLQGAFAEPQSLYDVAAQGLGHLTRVYGTRPVEPVERARWLWEFQRWMVTSTRHGIPALVHEECLTGLAAWRAATFATPLAWGATFDPELVREAAALVGRSMRQLGVHQGLAPVLDVVRDPRWGRVEECISEDPYVVATLGTAYVEGLQSEGVHATLKHFVGYSSSRAGRNFAPVQAGRRELEDILMVPFEMAVVEGGVRSVMHAYNEVDGIPAAASVELLTGVLRDRWGFDGTVVADYFGVAFLHLLHGVAEDLGDAAGQALLAGVDVELPTGDAYLAPLAEAVRAGRVDEGLVDRACARILRQKADLGLLGNTFEDEPPTEIELDSPAHRDVSRRLAEASVVLLSNDGTLPLPGPGNVALIGPNADRVAALFGCYSFINHVIPQHPGTDDGLAVDTVRQALGTEWPSADVTYVQGCEVDSSDTSGFAAAVEAAVAADVAVLVMGDSSGLFGRATSGEGCDRDDLELPGVQRALVEAVLETGTPVVLVLVTGRPYAVGWALQRCSAVVQSFFPGEEGAGAIAGVLSGRLNPSGRLPVSLPRSSGSQPYSYLHPILGGDSDVTNLSTRPALPFGHGLSYTTFHQTLLGVGAESTADGLRVRVGVSNVGERAGTDVVQLYVRDLVASVTRPVAQLVGYARVHLEAGESRTVELDVPSTRLAFTARDGRKVVEPGALEVWVGAPDGDRQGVQTVELRGDVHEIDLSERRRTHITLT